MVGFSDYIVYVDESGDHGLNSIDPDFPVFCLTFCIVTKRDYFRNIVPAFQEFKFEFWGHDGIVFHERDIRKNTGPFALLRTDENLRDRFFKRLNKLMEDAEITILAAVIDKSKLTEKYPTPWNPYHTALLFCMERLLKFLHENGQKGKSVHIVFESRGKNEDHMLQGEFHKICENRGNWGYRDDDFMEMAFEPVFQKKEFNSTGLQLADLTARPIAIHYMRPMQENRAYNIIRTKYGVEKCFP